MTTDRRGSQPSHSARSDGLNRSKRISGSTEIAGDPRPLLSIHPRALYALATNQTTIAVGSTKARLGPSARAHRSCMLLSIKHLEGAFLARSRHSYCNRKIIQKSVDSSLANLLSANAAAPAPESKAHSGSASNRPHFRRHSAKLMQRVRACRVSGQIPTAG